ncbi:MAG: T9SS type A sorting domain-containing protein, partial [Bacteroidota bacterium]
ELRAGGGPVGGDPPGLIGYNIYRDAALVHTTPHKDTISWWDYGLNPGTYKYEVKAKYDLTPYGFPGQFGESLGNTAGEKSVTLICGAPLPFYEPWDAGTFGFNNWAPSGHWTMNTGIGNPAPSADFNWAPALTNYSQALTSEVIDASAWTCAKIWLDFDLKLIDRNNTGKEKLTIDIFYGGSWHQKMEVSNNGSTNWVPKHINIDVVKGKAFRIRFVASGVNSSDMLHWYVDNVHAYGICNPAKTLAASQSQFTTTLTWVAPDCASIVPTVLVKLFQWSGTPDNAYFQAYNRAYGVVYSLATYPDASLNKIDFHHASWGTTGIWQYKIHVVDWTTFVEIATLGPLTTTGDDKWENNIPLGSIPGVGGKQIGIMLEPLSNSPTDAYPDFSADNVGPDGVSVFGDLPNYSAFAASAVGDFMQNLWIEIPAGDGNQLVQPTKVNVNTLAVNSGTKVATAVKPSPSFLMTNQVALINNESDSSVLSGYNVYRSDAPGAAFNLLPGCPVTATTFVDVYPSSLVSGTFKYFVSTLYKNSVDNSILCTPSSDTITVTFPHVGINELTNGQIMIYPNPATEIVNVKSNYTINRIDVMNYVGQTVYFNATVDAKTARINVATFTPGVYFVKVSTSEGMRMVKITVTH